jgi:hypothetical protein
MAPDTDTKQPPEVTPAETVDEIVAVSKRQKFFPLRRDFLQRTVDGNPVAGPLSELVKAGDKRALLLYSLLLTKASAEPWDAALPSVVWARALDLPLPDSKGARSTISKVWLRLENHGLVRRERSKRWADVFLLKEDGLGDDYTSPGEAGDRYVRIPLALWKSGPEPGVRWYQELSLPELALLFISRSLSDGFRFPYEMGPAWYGISADTVARGIDGLLRQDLLRVNKTFKKAPLSPVGYTAEHRYTLQNPFGPVGRKAPTSTAGRTLAVAGPRPKVKLRTLGNRKIVAV